MKQAAGILAYKVDKDEFKVLLVHPGGPYNKNKDESYWSIPKGEFEESEEPQSAAKREFQEELGIQINSNLISIGSVKTSSKVIYGYTAEFSIPFDHTLKSNSARIEWPPKSNKFIEIPEVDRAEYFDIQTAKQKILKTQLPFIERLESLLNI